MPIERVSAAMLSPGPATMARATQTAQPDAGAVTVEISATTRLRAAGGLPFFADRSGAAAFQEEEQSEALANVERSRKDTAPADTAPEQDADPLQRVQAEQARKARQEEPIARARTADEQREKSTAATARRAEEQRAKEMDESRAYERVTDEETRKKLSEERLKQADRPEEAIQREGALKAAFAARRDPPPAQVAATAPAAPIEPDDPTEEIAAPTVAAATDVAVSTEVDADADAAEAPRAPAQDR